MGWIVFVLWNIFNDRMKTLNKKNLIAYRQNMYKSYFSFDLTYEEKIEFKQKEKLKARTFPICSSSFFVFISNYIYRMTNVQFFFFFFFSFYRRRRWAKGETSFFVLYLLFEYTSMLYNLTYICPLARSLVRRVASAVDREKKEDEEEEYSPFLFVQNESFDHYFFPFLSQDYYYYT